MKKCKLALIGFLFVLSMGALVACGNKNNEETGSNTDSGNNNETTAGVIEEVVTDAATGVKDVVTEAATILEDAATGVGDMLNDGVDNATIDNNISDNNSGTVEQTMER